MSLVSPRAVLARVAGQVPEQCRRNIIVVGSLAAAYQLLGESDETLVRTKDIDCMLVPRVEAVRAGKRTAEALLAAGWRRPTEGPHAKPGAARTRAGDLPVVRLYPPDSSVRHLDVAAYEPIDTPEGLRCARLSMLVLSNLLRNPTIRPERMLAPGGLGPRRSNKDLGRVLTIARLAGRDAAAEWPAAWAAALQALYSARWRKLAARAGSGIRALLASEGDLQEALETSRVGLLAHLPMSLDEFRVVGERLLVDAIEPLEDAARDRAARAAKTGARSARRRTRRPR